MEVVIVRHGRPLTERRETGVADPGLDEFGVWQAQRVSAWLAHEHVDTIVSSPKARAIQTVRPLADELGLEIETVPGFDEIDRNSSVYVPTDAWHTDALDLIEALTEQRYDDIGYDHPDVFRQRVHEAWHAFVAEAPGDKVVLACHGGTIREILRAVLVEPPESFHASVEFASITRIRVDEHRSFIASLNETGHFDADRIAMRGPMNTTSTMRP